MKSFKTFIVERRSIITHTKTISNIIENQLLKLPALAINLDNLTNTLLQTTVNKPVEDASFEAKEQFKNIINTYCKWYQSNNGVSITFKAPVKFGHTNTYIILATPGVIDDLTTIHPSLEKPSPNIKGINVPYTDGTRYAYTFSDISTILLGNIATVLYRSKQPITENLTIDLRPVLDGEHITWTTLVTKFLSEFDKSDDYYTMIHELGHSYDMQSHADHTITTNGKHVSAEEYEQSTYASKNSEITAFLIQHSSKIIDIIVANFKEYSVNEVIELFNNELTIDDIDLSDNVTKKIWLKNIYVLANAISESTKKLIHYNLSDKYLKQDLLSTIQGVLNGL